MSQRSEDSSVTLTMGYVPLMASMRPNRCAHSMRLRSFTKLLGLVETWTRTRMSGKSCSGDLASYKE